MAGTHLFVEGRPFAGRDWAFLSVTLALVAAALILGTLRA